MVSSSLSSCKRASFSLNEADTRIVDVLIIYFFLEIDVFGNKITLLFSNLQKFCVKNERFPDFFPILFPSTPLWLPKLQKTAFYRAPKLAIGS